MVFGYLMVASSELPVALKVWPSMVTVPSVVWACNAAEEPVNVAPATRRKVPRNGRKSANTPLPRSLRSPL
ncbi:hypothetical protein D9M68_882560 [compost metagenome]|nr:hypothetical protein Y695_02303 [Hydrogenophaga sp. T4]